MKWYPVKRDPRYTVTLEGSALVARFGDEVIYEGGFRSSAVARCVGHHAVRNGAAVVTERR